MTHYLLLADSNVKDLCFLLSTVTPQVTYVIFYPKIDTLDSILSKIPPGTYSRVGILQDNTFTETYTFVESMGKSILEEVSTQDPTLATWTPLIQF